MRFSKWQGLGNDYIILEASELAFPLTVSAISLLCDRHYGVGSDGILLNDSPTGRIPEAIARMRVFNPDGSEPEMCGNGIRMFARYLQKTGRAPVEEFVVETLAGPVRPRLLPNGRVRVDMGEARFISESLDTSQLVSGVAPYFTLEAGGDRHDFIFVDVGNPHCILVVPDVSKIPLATVGPVLETHPAFPNRVNVEFVQVEPDGSVTMRVWERGVGETQACGTGATAVGVAAVHWGLSGSPVLVHLLGGDLEIEVSSRWEAIMTGGAEEVFTGSLSPEMLARLGVAS